MAISFPPNPQIGDTYTAPNGYTYTWDGTKWYVSSGGSGGSGGSGVPLIVEDEGSVVNTATTTINFVGVGVTATSVGSTVTVTILPGLENWEQSNTVIDSTQTSISSFLALGNQPNIDASIEPKGEGANIADVGGNKRGAYATDWQKQRGSNNEVASGDYSVIGGGSFNIASGLHSAVLSGNNNTANSNYSVVVGGNAGTTRGIIGSIVTPGFATGGLYTNPGAMQSVTRQVGGITNSTSPIRLSTNGSPVPTINNQIGAGDRSSVYFKGQVVAREQVESNGEIACWTFEGLLRQDIGSTTTDFVPTGIAPTVNLVASTTSTTWQLNLDIDNVLGCLIIQAIGSNTQTIRWTGKIETVEVTDES